MGKFSLKAALRILAASVVAILCGSPVNSTFGFYLGQLKGQVFTIGMTGFY